MATKYLDSTGLAYFWSKIKAYGDTHWGGGSGVLDFYPVGSYYETSDSNFDPNLEWGGTWVEDTNGRVTVAHDGQDTDFDTIGGTGGRKDAIVPYHNHGSGTLETDSYYHGHDLEGNTGNNTAITVSGGGHKHSLNQRNAGTTGGRATNNVTYGASGHDYQTTNAFPSSDGTHSHTLSAHTHSLSTGQAKPVGTILDVNGSTAYTGNQNDDANANLQPYVVVYRWHRTA